MMKIFSTLLILVVAGCGRPDCSNLPQTYNSYGKAVKAIHSANFNFTDKVNTSKSSWIKAASFFSCNSKTGYFIIVTDKQSYIHKDMPIEIWNNFKEAASFGSYYNSVIKYRYQLLLTE